MGFGKWMWTGKAVLAIALVGAPAAAFVTLTIALALALIGLIGMLAFETICEADRQRARQRRHTATRPDRALRQGQIPKARLVI
jgi:hypothetical protein